MKNAFNQELFEEDISVTRKVQPLMRDMLKEVVEICQRHGICYIGMPDRPLMHEIYYNMLLLRRAMPKICMPETIQTGYWHHQSGFRKIIIRLVQKIPFGKVLFYPRQVRKLKKCCVRYPYDQSNYVMLYSSAYEKKEILKKDYYGNGTVGKFEEIQVCMSSDYDKILTQLYGDYMTPPPEDKRVGSHIKEIIEIHT